ncbi:MAG: hypothetical protein ACR2PY_04920 [Salinispira sp.]
MSTCRLHGEPVAWASRRGAPTSPGGAWAAASGRQITTGSRLIESRWGHYQKETVVLSDSIICYY